MQKKAPGTDEGPCTGNGILICVTCGVECAGDLIMVTLDLLIPKLFLFSISDLVIKNLKNGQKAVFHSSKKHSYALNAMQKTLIKRLMSAKLLRKGLNKRPIIHILWISGGDPQTWKSKGGGGEGITACI